MWSLGCVIAELLLQIPLFPGENGTEQIVEIIKIIGTPTKDDIAMMNPHYEEFKFPSLNALPWEKIFKPGTDPNAIKFLSSLLVYNPEERPNPLLALTNPYFDELRDQSCRLPNGWSIDPVMFEFTQVEEDYAEKIGQPNLISANIPPWYKDTIDRKK